MLRTLTLLLIPLLLPDAGEPVGAAAPPEGGRPPQEDSPAPAPAPVAGGAYVASTVRARRVESIELGESIDAFASRVLGHPHLWPQIVEANADIFQGDRGIGLLPDGRPRDIYPGLHLTVPDLSSRESYDKAIAANRAKWAAEDEAAKTPEHLRAPKG